MINVIKGILYRMINSKTYLIMPIIITPIVIVAAIYFQVVLLKEQILEWLEMIILILTVLRLISHNLKIKCLFRIW